jgi:class 3 adenylate cyclase/tetratricopeptide (TPR) repeat protein
MCELFCLSSGGGEGAFNPRLTLRLPPGSGQYRLQQHSRSSAAISLGREAGLGQGAFLQANDRTLATLSAYVPGYIRDRIAEADEGFDGPSCSPLTVAVLFADISGFTLLTEKYERQGRLGIERLTEILNDYFTRTIGRVMECGGDIESISGDGLVAFWQVRPGFDLASCVRHAAECGRRLHETVRAILPDGAPLRLRVALVCGDAFAVEVGGTAERRHFVLSGPPLGEITETLGHADPGETAMSPAVAALLGTGTSAADRPIYVGGALPLSGPGQPRAPLHAGHVKTLMRFVPRHLARLAEPGGHELFAEFRRISTCFLRLRGLVCNSPEDLERVQQAIGRADVIIGRYGGGDQRLTMNDKGALLMVVFGLPGSTHENDPVRAVLAMRELLTALDDLWLDCTCGVTLGVAYCGPIGSDERRTYTVLGASVNLAASLSDLSGHRIVCDADIARAASQQIAFEPLPSTVSKGVSHDTRLYRPSTRRARAAEARDIMGRGGELKDLISLLDRRLTDRGGALAVLEGEAGIGKSTILRALTKEAVERGFQVLTGSTDPYDRSTPFRAWREPFGLLLNVDSAGDGTAVLRAVADWTHEFPDLAQLAPLLGPVLSVSLPDTSLTRHMQGAVRAENTMSVMLRTLSEAAQRKPTLLVLDDVQWLDPSSLDLLGRLDVEALGLVVCLAARSGGVEGDQTDFEALCSRPHVLRLRIQGLANDAIGALIARRVGAMAVPEDLIDFVRERAAGNPYYSEEIAAILLEAGRLAVADGQCRISGALDDLAMDGSIEGVIASRVDLLRLSEQHTVKVASVQGRQVAYEMLSGVRHLDDHEPPLPDQLAELTRREILLLLGEDRTGQYLFKHLITQQAIYNRLLFSQRRELHKAVAEWMERRYAGEIEVHQAVIGTHWSLAEMHDKAATCFERAGERSLRGGADRETINLLERAMASLRKVEGPRDKPREARILRQLGDAHRRRGALVESEQTLLRALRRLNESWPKSSAGVGARLLAELLRQLWRRTMPVRPAATSDRDTELANIHGHLSSIYYFLNRPPEMMLATARGVNAGERSTDKLLLAEAYLLFSNVMGIVGLHRAARHYVQLADASLAADLTSVQKMQSNELRSLYLGAIAELAVAEAALGEMLAASKEIGDDRHLREALSLLGIVTLMKGEAEKSRQYRDAFFDRAMRVNDDQTQCWAWIERAEHDLRRGDLAAAVEGFTKATSLLGKVSSTERIWIAGQLAQAHLWQGDVDAARAAAASGLASFAVAPPTGFYALEGCAGIADVFLSIVEGAAAMPGDRRSAIKAVARLGAFARGFPISRPRHLLGQARLRALKGSRRKAELLIAEAVETARRLALPYDLALAEFHLGRLTEGAARRAHLEDAAKGFEAVGAPGMAARAREALSVA